ncbi:hypothetical protein FQN52_001206 [Onygenales sp. PD_12]|nr:hypothetical protein FQN52_001206 [Onygenales sp. PD_12]KAK2791367.1 hypothetical protein FQN53_004548 [Emmonsiellopsis sp. PD_33]
MDIGQRIAPFRLTHHHLLGAGYLSSTYAIEDCMAFKAPILYGNDIAATEEQTEQTVESSRAFSREKHAYDIINRNPHANILQSILHCHEGTFLPRMWLSLDDWMKGGMSCATPLSTRLRWVTELVSAVAHLEQLGLVHGDIRPANTLLDHRLRLKLAEFDSCIRIGQPCVASTIPFHDGVEDIASHQTEQFAVGSFIYCVFRGIEPEFQLTGETLQEENFPNVTSLLGKDIILKCWNKEYESVAALNEEVMGMVAAAMPYTSPSFMDRHHLSSGTQILTEETIQQLRLKCLEFRRSHSDLPNGV